MHRDRFVARSADVSRKVADVPVHHAVEFDGSQSVSERGDAALDLRQRKSGPPREVARRSGAMTTKVTFGQARESVFAVELRGRRHTIVEKHIGVLFAVAWTAADDPLELGVHHDVGESLAGSGNPAAFELAGE